MNKYTVIVQDAGINFRYWVNSKDPGEAKDAAIGIHGYEWGVPLTELEAEYVFAGHLENLVGSNE